MIEKILKEHDIIIGKIITHCIIEIDNKYGRTKLIKILKGSKEKFIEELGHNNLKTYGALENYSEDKIKEIINNLIERNILKEETMIDYKIIDYTTEGRNWLYSIQEGLELEGDITHNEDVPPTDEASNRLYDELRLYRNKQSKEENIKQYMVFQNKTIKQLVYKKPTTIEDLSLIWGIGKKVSEKYGNDIIEIIKNHNSNEEIERKIEEESKNYWEMYKDNLKEDLDFMHTLKFGHEFEAEFEDYMLNDHKILIERADNENFKNPDFKGKIYYECKKLRTPFFKSEEYVKIHPSKAIPVKVKQFLRYKTKPDLVLMVFDLDYSQYPGIESKGIYIISVQKIKLLSKKYPDRGFKDKNGDIIYCINLDDCIKIEDLLGRQE